MSQQHKSTTLESFTSGSPSSGQPTTEEKLDANISTSKNEVPQKSKESDEYGTPPWIIRSLTDIIGQFDLDPAAGAEPANIRIAKDRFTIEDNGLTNSWRSPYYDSIFLNPPYSNPSPFLRKLKHAVDPDDPSAATFGIALVKSDTSTDWFHNHLSEATILAFINQRLKFVGSDRSGTPDFQNVLAIFGDPPTELLESISEYTQLYTRVQISDKIEQKQLDDLFSEDGGIAHTPSMHPLEQSQTNSIVAQLKHLTHQDTFRISYDESELIDHNQTAQQTATLNILPNTKTINPKEGVIAIDAIGTKQSGEDICAQIKAGSHIISQIQVTIAEGMNRWKQVTPTSIEMTPQSPHMVK